MRWANEALADMSLGNFVRKVGVDSEMHKSIQKEQFCDVLLDPMMLQGHTLFV